MCVKWAVRLEDVWRGKPRDSLDLALVDVRENYPTLPIAPFKVIEWFEIIVHPRLGSTRHGRSCEGGVRSMMLHE